MKPDAWHLPWSGDTVPHALLDINRGCNIRCDACYNMAEPSFKPLPQIQADLTALLARRHLASVAIVGGEVLLHPDLCDAIRLVKQHGLYAEVFTNGVLLDDPILDRMKDAGLDLVFLHIDSGQDRPGLPARPTADQLRALWHAKTSLVARHGIDAGLTMTAFESKLSEVRDMVAYVLDSAHVNYLLVTLFRDTASFARIRGSLDAGLRGERRDPAAGRCDTLTNARLCALMQSELGLRPFCYLGSNVDADDPRWLSYLVATSCARDGSAAWHALKVSAFEKVFLKLSLLLAGKYPMYRRQSAFHLAVQLIMNGLLGGDSAGNAAFLAKHCRSGDRLCAKRLLFQCPAEIADDGTVIHCAHCPDAVVKDGQLVPVCIADLTDVKP
jgi:hypothetical protein